MNAVNPQPLLTAADLQQLQFLSRRLSHRQRRAAVSPWSGPHLSAARGHGLEFADLRPYQAGDDIRHMDWRATARTGKPTTKVFLEDRQRTLHLVVDRQPGMWFGTRGDLKATVAARLAALHAFAALDAGDTVSATIIDRIVEHHYPPTRTLQGVLTLLRAACAPADSPAAPTPSGHRPLQLLRHLTRAVARRSTVVIVSDFTWFDATLVGLLAQLARDHRVTALRVVDPAEQHLADVGLIRLVSPVSGITTVIDTGDSDLRGEYARAMQQRSNDLQQWFARAGVELTVIATDRDLLDTLTAVAKT
ncbi:MAG: hypothetical protein FD165_1074 [Gammaproteobacteria bacterium]|nr:MAG: hypothetical protein FD165_1074 [Gammaproteobacteria bacterium]TND06218.1 MAG: hypothetical protein FD120_705 [Gammaproteobacteria bacterium]